MIEMEKWMEEGKKASSADNEQTKGKSFQTDIVVVVDQIAPQKCV